MYKYLPTIIRYFLIFTLILGGNTSFAEQKDSTPESHKASTPTPNEQDTIKGTISIKPATSAEDKKHLSDYSPENIDQDKIDALRAFILQNEAVDRQIVERLYPIDPHTRKRTTLPPRLWSTIKGFPVEALVFYAAIGASMFRKAQTDRLMSGGRTDPRWLEAFINEQVTSTIGIFSFFCFVLASGLSSHLYSKATGLLGFKAENSLAKQRSRLSNSFSHFNLRKYKLTRSSFGVVAQFSGQVGMAFGLLASNIVHEIYNLYHYNPDWKRCRDAAMSSENAKLACTLALNEVGHTALSWAPGLASMLTAATLSHAAVRGLLIVGKKTIHTPFLSRVSMTVASKIGLAKAASLLTFIVPGTVFPKAAMLTFRFINLYAFMEVEQLFTHHLWDWLWGEGQKANKLAGSMENFIKYHDVKYFTPWRHCKDETKTDCAYHDSIHSIHYVSNSFNRWRQYKMQMASMAHQSWFLYVSNALGSFNLAKNIYRDLFLSKNNSNPFNEVKYLGNTTLEKEDLGTWYNQLEYQWSNDSLTVSTENIDRLTIEKLKNLKNRYLYIDDKKIHITEVLVNENGLELKYMTNDNIYELKEKSSITVQMEGKALHVFRNMQQKLDAHIEEHNMKEPEDLEFNVVSFSPGQFLKSIEIHNGLINTTKWWENRHFVLRKLLSAHDPNVDLRPFYGYGNDYENARQAIREEVLQNTLNTTYYLKDYFNLVEQTIRNIQEIIKEQDTEEQTNTIQTLLYVLSEQQILPILNEIGNRRHYELNLPQCLGNPENNYNKQFNCLADALSIKKENKGFLSWYFEVLKTYYDILYPGLQKDYQEAYHEVLNPPSYPSYLLNTLLESITNFKEEIKNSKNTAFLDEKKAKVEINSILRKRVLAAGVEYLNKILEMEKIRRRSITSNSISTEIHNKAQNGEIPTEVLSTFLQLGEDNIFARLYEEAFHIKPKVRGMNTVDYINEAYKVKEQINQMKPYSSRLKNLRTPGAMDFLIASAVCGPELQDEKHIKLIQTMENIKEGQSSLEESFSEETGVFGKIGNMLGNIIRGKLILNQIFEDQFPGLEMDDIVNQIPVFDRPMGGMSFTFSPPYMTNIDNQIRQEICRGFHSQNTHGIVENIYDIPRPITVNGKKYSNLLLLVQDHIGRENISSVEDFDNWWEKNIEPYRKLFIMAADREYRRMMKHNFMKPLFRNDTKEILMESPIHPHSNKHPFDDLLTDTYPVKEYFVKLPRGVFQNIVFELNYWADIILHFGKKRKNFLQGHEDEELKSFSDKINIEKVEHGLRNFINYFQLETCSADTETLKTEEQIKKCIDWTNKFMANVQETKDILKVFEDENDETIGIAHYLEIDFNSLSGCEDPYGPSSGLYAHYDSIEEQQAMVRNAFSCFTINSNSYKKPEDNPKADLPDQLLQFSLMRLQGILHEAMSYVNMINSISENPDVMEAQQTSQTAM